MFRADRQVDVNGQMVAETAVVFHANVGAERFGIQMGLVAFLQPFRIENVRVFL